MADDVFLSRVTHDLRGELSTVIAGVHYLLRYEPSVSPAGRQMLDRVSGAGQRLRRLLDELELSAWIDGTKPPISAVAEPCAPEALVRAAAGRVERAAAGRGVIIEIGAPPDLPEITVDREVFGAAVEMVIDFAASRSPDRKVVVSLARAGASVEVRVSDEGGAAPAEAMARIFEPFAEKDLVPRPAPGGRRRERLGLGLAIARGVAAAFGGALTAASSPAGITFALSIPA